MDPLTLAISTILGKYAIDKGATLLKEAGQAAANAAGKLFDKVMQHLKADPAEAKNAERFEQNPEGYKAPMADAIDEKLKADPNLAAELKSLVEEFERARPAGGISIMGNTTGDIMIGSNVKLNDNSGVINIGGTYNTTSTQNRSGGTDINASNVDVDGDVTGRDKTSAS